MTDLDITIEAADRVVQALTKDPSTSNDTTRLVELCFKVFIGEMIALQKEMYPQ